MTLQNTIRVLDTAIDKNPAKDGRSTDWCKRSHIPEGTDFRVEIRRYGPDSHHHDSFFKTVPGLLMVEEHTLSKHAIGHRDHDKLEGFLLTYEVDENGGTASRWSRETPATELIDLLLSRSHQDTRMSAQIRAARHDYVSPTDILRVLVETGKILPAHIGAAIVECDRRNTEEGTESEHWTELGEW